MPSLSFTVPQEYDGVMVKSFLRSFCKVSARLLTKLKRQENGIIANGRGVRAIDRLCAGDRLCLFWEETNAPLPQNETAVPVIYEDETVVVFDKPSDMPVHPSPGHDRDTLANAAAAFAAKIGECWAFRPVYRLDRDTTGLVVIAKDAYAAARLAGQVSKRYIAVCEGVVSGDGVIDNPIRLKDGHTIQREAGKGGERAVTHYKALKSGGGHTALSIRLETGRTHQIRVHLSSTGHPLAGDDMYGGGRSLIKRQALHCESVRFIHPVTQKEIRLQSFLPNDMAVLLKRCQIDAEWAETVR